MEVETSGMSSATARIVFFIFFRISAVCAAGLVSHDRRAC